MKGKKLLRTGVPAVLVCAVLAASFSLYRTLADKGPEDILTSSLPEGEKAPQSTGTNTGSTSQANSITTAADSPLILDVPYVSQEGLLPTGCETVSAVMLVQHYGMDINVHEFIDRCLKCSDFWYEDGMLTNVSPTEAFIGDPYQADGLGCYAPVMVDALNAFFEEKAYAFRAEHYWHFFGGTMQPVSCSGRPCDGLGQPPDEPFPGRDDLEAERERGNVFLALQ